MGRDFIEFLLLDRGQRPKHLFDCGAGLDCGHPDPGLLEKNLSVDPEDCGEGMENGDVCWNAGITLPASDRRTRSADKLAEPCLGQPEFGSSVSDTPTKAHFRHDGMVPKLWSW
jgi:hypothetical protein